jgi:hypothetical protein
MTAVKMMNPIYHVPVEEIELSNVRTLVGTGDLRDVRNTTSY